MAQEILLKLNNQRLTINPLGGGIKDYFLLHGNQRRDIVYGYQSDDQKAGSMGDVLFPFPGRVEEGEYDFSGQHYTLSGLRIKDGNAIHGFAKTALWNIENQSSDTASLSFSIDENEYTEKGYPFSVRLDLCYQLSKEGMSCKALITNTGDKPAPVGLGFHPYFSIGVEMINNISLKFGANSMLEFDQNLKPTGEKVKIDKSNYNFNQADRIGDRIIDNCFTDLVLANDGVVIDSFV